LGKKKRKTRRINVNDFSEMCDIPQQNEHEDYTLLGHLIFPGRQVSSAEE
jgi:hypothetical protein